MHRAMQLYRLLQKISLYIGHDTFQRASAGQDFIGIGLVACVFVEDMGRQISWRDL